MYLPSPFLVLSSKYTGQQRTARVALDGQGRWAMGLKDKDMRQDRDLHKDNKH